MALVQSIASIPSSLAARDRLDLSVSDHSTPGPTSTSFGAKSVSSRSTVDSGAHQRNMSSFGAGSFSQITSAYPLPPKGYVAANAPMMHQQHQQPQQQHQSLNQRPSIYTAVYSGISVYEMEVKGVVVMRRRDDSWLNATQILKVAGVEKGKRTKVLEKEILSGQHEKVQGGYGKYQGTWISYDKGLNFCRKWGVEDILRPLLEYDMGQDGLSVAGQGSAIDTPTKEQAMAAQRKKMMYHGGTENRPPAHSPDGTFFKSLSASAVSAVQAINKAARFDSPGPRPASGNRRPAPNRRQSSQVHASQDSQFPPSSQQSMHSVYSEGSFPLEPAFASQNTSFYTQPKRPRSGIDMHEPARKRVKSTMLQDSYPHLTNGLDQAAGETTPTQASGPYFYNHNAHLSHDNTSMSLPPLPQPATADAVEKHQSLTSLFMDTTQTDFSDFDLRLAGEDLDIPIDATAHTALHWAATLARLPLVKMLVGRGASIFRVNGGGETALMRAVASSNNLDQASFPELLELLGPSIEMRDGRGRTILHHIAISSAIKGKSAACRYYLESLLEFVVRQGSVPNSRANSFHEPIGMQKPRAIGLAKFMSEIVNAQDMSGDTALNMASRAGNKSIIQQLLEVGANPAIPNRGGLKPTDFGVGGEADVVGVHSSSSQTLPSSQTNKIAETHRDLVTSMTTLLEDTENTMTADLRAKQSLIDQAHAKLKETTTQLNTERQRLTDLQRRLDARKDLRQQIATLRRSNETQKTEIFASGAQPDPHVFIGEADKGLEFDISKLPPSPSANPSAEQVAYLERIPAAEVLDAWINAYQAHNDGLVETKKGLEGRSSALERKLKRLVALTSNIEESKVEDKLGELLYTVEREPAEEVDPGRLRKFLQRVEGEAE